MKHKSCVLLSTFIMLMAVNAALMAANKINNPCQILSRSINAKKIPPHTAQMIVVKSLGGSKANVTLCQRQGAAWWTVFTPPFRAVIGKHGIASIGEKKEGDLKTPAGIYPIGEAFGSQPLALKMDFKYITTDDKFIDDVNSKDYNMWVTGSTDAKSYEPMLIKPYIYGAVVNYNMNPMIAGAGSAIFIHLWQSSHEPTAGCVAMDKKHLLMLLHWLDKKYHPHIMVS